MFMYYTSKHNLPLSNEKVSWTNGATISHWLQHVAKIHASLFVWLELGYFSDRNGISLGLYTLVACMRG